MKLLRSFITPTIYPPARKREDEVGSDEVGHVEDMSKKIPRGVSPWFFIGLLILRLLWEMAVWFMTKRHKGSLATKLIKGIDSKIYNKK